MNLVIIAGGKSVGRHLKTAEDWLALRAIPNTEIWCLNSSFMPLPFTPDRICWVDKSFFENNRKILLDTHAIHGTLLVAKEHPAKYYSSHPIITYKTHREHGKFNDDSMFVGSAGLSGLFALSLAYKLKYDKYFLFGYDGGTTGIADRNTHWYQDLATDLDIKSHGFGRSEVYLDDKGNFKHKNDYEYYVKNYPSEVSKTYNISANSNIDTFMKIDLDTFYKEIG